MARKIRITLAAVSFTLVTLLFLDFTGALHHGFGWLAKIQFLPALIALNAAVAGAVALLTILFGRIYCSVVCPLGIFQDIVSAAAGKIRKNRFSYSPALTAARSAALAVFALSIIAGIGSLTAVLEPYSAYGRIASTLAGPVYMAVNNVLAYCAERMNSYAFYSGEIWLKSLSALIVSIMTLGVLFFLAWKNGRTWCNAVCPAGTVLGFLSKYALVKPRIDENACTHCGVCEKNCRASCIDAEAGTIDHSRCVMCLDCTAACPRGGIRVAVSKPAEDRPVQAGPVKNGISRGKFLSLVALLALTTAAKAYAKKFDGGLALLKERKAPKRSTGIVPPGSVSMRNFSKRCTGCHLCVSACPNRVLIPSGGLKNMLQPRLSYEHGYCRPECTQCSAVCPTGAINRITTVEKSAIQIGLAVWSRDLCVVNSDKVSCNNCARHCPAGAIQMIPQSPNDPASLNIPMVDITRCIGCGACENLCPARPYSAIHVEGHEKHQII